MKLIFQIAGGIIIASVTLGLISSIASLLFIDSLFSFMDKSVEQSTRQFISAQKQILNSIPRPKPQRYIASYNKRWIPGRSLKECMAIHGHTLNQNIMECRKGRYVKIPVYNR